MELELMITNGNRNQTNGNDSKNTGISAPGSARYFLALLYIVLLGVRLSQKYSH